MAAEPPTPEQPTAAPPTAAPPAAGLPPGGASAADAPLAAGRVPGELLVGASAGEAPSSVVGLPPGEPLAAAGADDMSAAGQPTGESSADLSPGYAAAGYASLVGEGASGGALGGGRAAAGLLAGKVIVISGVGPGLGRGLAVQCARAGADVVLAARNGDRLANVAKEVEDIGRRAVTVPTDITDPAACERLAETARAAFGRVDGLVNNAFATPPLTDLTKVDLDSVRAGFETNVLAALRLTRLFVPVLEETRGSVVMINSAVLRHSRRTFGAYKMAKAALLAMAQSLSAELGPRGVRVNTIAPGYIWADNLRWYFEHLAGKRGVPARQIYDENAATTDLRKLPEPDEVADAAVFMLSPLARAVTGQCLDVNAGEWHH